LISVGLTFLNLLRYCGKRDMAKDCGLQDMNLRVWMARSNDLKRVDLKRYSLMNALLKHN
jgi:hypothetical protein